MNPTPLSHFVKAMRVSHAWMPTNSLISLGITSWPFGPTVTDPRIFIFSHASIATKRKYLKLYFSNFSHHKNKSSYKKQTVSPSGILSLEFFVAAPYLCILYYMKEKTHTKHHVYIDYPDTNWGRFLSGMFTFLTYIAILVVVVGSCSSPGDQYYQYVILGEYVFSILFLMDFVLRFSLSKFSVRFLLNRFTLADILSFLPLIVGVIHGERWWVESLNILRLCRVLRIFRVGKYYDFLRGLWKAVQTNMFKYKIAFTLFFVVWLIGSFLMYSIEHTHNPMFRTIPDAMWRSLVTMTTLWYGDKIPQTGLGKFCASSIIIFWPIFLSIITSITIITFLDVVKHITQDTSMSVCPECQTPHPTNTCRFCSQCWALL